VKGLFRGVSGLAVAALVLTSLALLPPTALAAVSCTPQYAADGHPYINPAAQGPGSGRKVGFDSAHAETAGQADWVIDGGFSDMACALAGQGYFVEEMRTYPLTTEVMNAYDVVVLAEANMPLTNAEEQAIEAYVAGGKGVLFVGDHYQSDRNLNTWDSPEVFNGFRRGHYGRPTRHPPSTTTALPRLPHIPSTTGATGSPRLSASGSATTHLTCRGQTSTPALPLTTRGFCPPSRPSE
jgi:hypothetical protein